MPAELCEKCREREARVFLTQIIDGVMSKSKLCIECGEAAGIPWDHEGEEALKTATCRYCGSYPCVPGNDSILGKLDGRPRSFMCQACQGEHLGFVQGELRTHILTQRDTTHQTQP